mgnify:FL=1
MSLDNYTEILVFFSVIVKGRIVKNNVLRKNIAKNR